MNEKELRALVATEALKWIGTPFYPHCCKLGVGVDCINFGLAVYKAVGIMPKDFRLPEYRITGGDHLHTSAIIDWLAESKCFLSEQMPTTGSLITMNFGRVAHHIAVMVGPMEFVHAIRTHGVVRRTLQDSTWASKLNGSWKPICLETHPA